MGDTLQVMSEASTTNPAHMTVVNNLPAESGLATLDELKAAIKERHTLAEMNLKNLRRDKGEIGKKIAAAVVEEREARRILNSVEGRKKKATK